MSQLSPPLRANRAFVVQFRAQPIGEPPPCEGRVEHLVSGQATRFTSQAPQIRSFMNRRDKLIEHINTLIAERTEGAVLF